MKLPEKILYAHEHTTIDLSGPKKNIDCRLDDFDATAAEYRRLAVSKSFFLATSSLALG